jgi:hypothetical protein
VSSALLTASIPYFPFRFTAAQLAQLLEHQSVMREVMVQIPAGPTTQVLKITKENVLPL